MKIFYVHFNNCKAFLPIFDHIQQSIVRKLEISHIYI